MAAPAIPPMAVLKPPVVHPESAPTPTAVFSLPVELLSMAVRPTAVLLIPPVLSSNAAVPTAVLLSSVVFKASVPAPRPVLKLPVVLLVSERQPTAVLPVPVVMLKRAWSPSAVFNPGKGVSGAACAFSKGGKQTSADRIAANIRSRFFIDLGLSFHCLAFREFPLGTPVPHLREVGPQTEFISDRCTDFLRKELCQKCGWCVKKKNAADDLSTRPDFDSEL
jgi:hypothetical protein